MRTSLVGFPNPVDEVSARLVALGVATMATFYLATRSPWVLAILAWGFVARVITGPKLSPLGLLVTRVVRPRMAIAERPTPGPPKRFAQAIGAAVSTTALVSSGSGATGVAYGLIAVLAVFASLEAFVGFCVGCWLFRRLMRTGLVSDSTCEACNDVWDRVRA